MRLLLLPALTCTALILTTSALAPSAEASVPTSAHSDYRKVEAHLAELGIPGGPVDGRFDSQAGRAACVWRELTGAPVSRTRPDKAEQADMLATQDLAVKAGQGPGIWVNRQCQVAYWVTGSKREPKLRAVFAVSTGMSGHETPVGSYRIQRQIDGWHESTKYAGAMMFRPKYFNGGIALHGSFSDDLVHSYPASHGCTRMFHADINRLWKAGVGVGTPVHVYGSWKG